MHALRVGVRHLALVPGDPGQAQRPRAGHRVGDRRAPGLGAHAGPGTRTGGQLDHDVQRAGGARVRQGRVHQLDAAHGVGVADEAEAGVGVQLGGDPAQGAGVDQLVGQEDPLDAERPRHPYLVRHGQGDAPGAVLDLAVEELRRHGGLAVRREGEAVPGGVRLHELQVVLQALGGQREDGGGETAGEEVAALSGQLGEGQAVGVRREALEAVVDTLLGQLGEGFAAACGAVVEGHGASLV